MKTISTIIIFCVGLFIISSSFSYSSSSLSKKLDDCSCDTVKLKKAILSKNYLSIRKYDKVSFLPDSLYSLSREENRMLWFRDIESPDTTKFTVFWNSYQPNNYQASNSDFINYYKNNKDIEMAFQLGPNGFMWSYYSFVIKKVKCCYVITQSTFTHARFRFRAYAILNKTEMGKLHEVLEPYKMTPVPDKEEYGYHGHFIDKRNDNVFFIDIAKQVDSTHNQTKEMKDFFDFLDHTIDWNITFDH